MLKAVNGIRVCCFVLALIVGVSGLDVHANNTATASGTDLWVDTTNGNDTHDGLTASTAYRTIQKAANMAVPGTTVHILPGTYRESVTPAQSGTASARITYRAENGPGTVIIRGSETSASAALAWTPLVTNNIGLPSGVYTHTYSADLSSWNLSGPPRFVAQIDASEVITRLPLARAPNWTVSVDWQYTANWWTAEGGSSVLTGCDPTANPNCDQSNRSATQLTDSHHLNSTLGNLAGATLVAVDTVEGHWVYHRTIQSNNQSTGTVTVQPSATFDGVNPGLGWASKYYVEGLPQLLDSPGEWWYDTQARRLYLWPTDPNALSAIEISRRDNGFVLTGLSYITLDGLSIELVNQSAVKQVNPSTQKSYSNAVRNATLRYANWGVNVEQDSSPGQPATNITDGFRLENSNIGYIDTYAIRLAEWWAPDGTADTWLHSGIQNTVIRNNEMHHLGFRSDSDSGDGFLLQYANKLTFVGNYIHNVAHNGVRFERSVIQSSKTYGFSPTEIKTGDILVSNNVFERACQMASDCGELNFGGKAPDNHVFRAVLIRGNVFRNTFGWSYSSQARRHWSSGSGSQVQGLGGFGLYLDHASGIHAYRNIAYNNAFAGYMFFGTWRDGDIVYYNNIAANSLDGMRLDDPQSDTHGNVNTQFVDNILVDNEGYGFWVASSSGNFTNVTINNNLYFNDGWRSSGGEYLPGDMVVKVGSSPYQYDQHLGDIRTHTAWEAQGVEGDPAFYSYNRDDHDMHDGSWPDLHLTPASANAIDRGVAALPASLTALLTEFGVADSRGGATFDIGRYEAGFTLLATPPIQAIPRGASAQFSLSLVSAGSGYTPTLAVASNPAPGLTASVNPANLRNSAKLTLAHPPLANLASGG